MILNDELLQARQALMEGKVVILPTETVYGLAVLSRNRDQLAQLKGHNISKNIAYAFESIDDILAIADPDPYVELAVRKLLPGPFTLLLKARSKEIIGARMPDNAKFQKVIGGLADSLAESNEYILLTSANAHGQPPAISFEQARESFPDLVGVDDGQTQYARPSLIIDLSSPR